MFATASSRFGIYNAIAPKYDLLHARFLRLAGGCGQGAIEGAVTSLLRPKMALLDAGCGTGLFARRLLSLEPSLDITLIDAAPAMLRQARDIPARRVHGTLSTLPFAEASFDLTHCSWAIETVENELNAVSELIRVTRRGGHLCIAFCANTPDTDMIDQLFARLIKLRGTGRFLDPENIRQQLVEHGLINIRRIACSGPVAVMIAEKT